MSLKQKFSKLAFLAARAALTSKKSNQLIFLNSIEAIVKYIRAELNVNTNQPTEKPKKTSDSFSGGDQDWSVKGNFIAVPDRYHKLGQQKRLASFEPSPILIENSEGKHFFMPTGKKDGSRHIYTLPATKGELKVLWDKQNPWWHEVAKVNLKKGSNRPVFKTYNMHGEPRHEDQDSDTDPEDNKESVTPTFSGKFAGNDNEWGVSGNFIAIPKRYHDLGQRKRLSQTEKSPILIEINHKKYFFMPTGKRDGSRYIYTLPKRQGELKVLWDTAEPWKHEFARVNLQDKKAYNIKFRTVDRHGRSASRPNF